METALDGFRHIIHCAFHLLVPFVLGKMFWKENWWKAGLIMVGTVVIDLDHLLAETRRCCRGAPSDRVPRGDDPRSNMDYIGLMLAPPSRRILPLPTGGGEP